MDFQWLMFLGITNRLEVGDRWEYITKTCCVFCWKKTQMVHHSRRDQLVNLHSPEASKNISGDCFGLVLQQPRCQAKLDYKLKKTQAKICPRIEDTIFKQSGNHQPESLHKTFHCVSSATTEIQKNSRRTGLEKSNYTYISGFPKLHFLLN